MGGSLLFSEVPYVAVVNEDYFGKKKLCWTCFLVKKVHICQRCKTAAYCSKECQQKDWETQHKEECVVFKNTQDHEDRPYLAGIISVRMAARILARKSIDGGVQDPKGEMNFHATVFYPHFSRSDWISGRRNRS